MSRFGTSVSDYLGKQNPLTAVQTTDVNQRAAASNTNPTGTGTASTTTQPAVDSAQNPSGFNMAPKQAVAGSTSPTASGLVGMIPSQIFQPEMTSNMGDRTDSIWGRENSINNTTTVLNDNMNLRTQGFNRQLAQNQQGQQGEDGQFTGNDPGNSGLTQEQYGNAQTIANVGKQRGMSDQDIKTAIMTGLTESGLRNLNYGDRDSLGLFQQRPSQGWGTPQQVTDPNYAANKFYDTLSRTNHAGMTPWAAAQAVQRSYDPTGSNYQRQYGLAERAYNALMSGSFNKTASTASSSPNAAQSWINQYNNKYVDYDGQFGAQCVDLYDYYTAGFVGGKVNMVGYASEIYNNYDSRAYNRYAANATPGHMGDVAVFRPGPGTPTSHVSIVVGDNGNGTLRVLSANATPAGSAGPTVIHNISKNTLMGYLRPNKLGG